MFFLKFGLRDNHGRQPLLDSILSFLDYPLDKDITGRNILDQSNDLTSGPDTMIRITVLIDKLSALTRDQGSNLGKLGSTGLTFDLDDLLSNLVTEDTSRVVKGTEDQGSVTFRGLDHRFLDVVVDRGLLSAEEASSHVDTLKQSSHRVRYEKVFVW